MFKRIRENKTIQKIKELWQNPKTHDIIVLVLWLVFIAIVILFVKLTISINDTTTTDNNLPYANFESISNYSFSYQYENTEINGQAYDDKYEFILNNHRYYYNDNIYMINGDVATKQNMNLDILKINPKMLNNLLGKLNGTETDGYTRYLVPLDRFINLYEIDTEADLSKAMVYNIVADVYKKDDQINKVVLDLTNYRSFRFGNNLPYNITLYFYNINKVNDFTTAFDKIVGGK